jgi:hypothetical protein
MSGTSRAGPRIIAKADQIALSTRRNGDIVWKTGLLGRYSPKTRVIRLGNGSRPEIAFRPRASNPNAPCSARSSSSRMRYTTSRTSSVPILSMQKASHHFRGDARALRARRAHRPAFAFRTARRQGAPRARGNEELSRGTRHGDALARKFQPLRGYRLEEAPHALAHRCVL